MGKGVGEGGAPPIRTVICPPRFPHFYFHLTTHSLTDPVPIRLQTPTACPVGPCVSHRPLVANFSFAVTPTRALAPSPAQLSCSPTRDHSPTCALLANACTGYSASVALLLTPPRQPCLQRTLRTGIAYHRNTHLLSARGADLLSLQPPTFANRLLILQGPGALIMSSMLSM